MKFGPQLKLALAGALVLGGVYVYQRLRSNFKAVVSPPPPPEMP